MLEYVFIIDTEYQRASMKIFNNSEQIGRIGYGMGNHVDNKYPIAYEIDEEFRRQGIMKEALEIFCRLVPYDRLEAFILESNVASQSLIKSVGFSLTRVTHSGVLVFEKILRERRAA